MIKRVSAFLVLVVVLVVVLVLVRESGRSSTRTSTSTSTSTTTSQTGDVGSDARRGATATSRSTPAARRTTVTVSGHVLDGTTPVASAEVLFRDDVAEATTQTRGDGSFSIELRPGSYHVAVHGAGVLVASPADRERLDADAGAAIVGLPEDSLMPLVRATADVANLDIGVVPAATITGRVVDPDGRAVAHAIVRTLHPPLRPVLGTDSAETDDGGEFTLEVPAGRYTLGARAKDFAGLAHGVVVNATAHASARVALLVGKGCEVRGRVVHADGTAAGDGAIEQQFGPTEDSFRASGHVESDGTFRWTTMSSGEVTLRAWPWKEMPSEVRTFNCTDGARFDVVLRVPQRAPALAGTVVDASGAPVPFAYIDIESSQLGVASQQERADAAGHWEVHELVAGMYRISGSAAGRGIAVTAATAPRDEPVELRLGGTGRIEGTTSGLANGTIEVVFAGCFDAPDPQHRPMEVAHEPRLVTVAGGRFAIDDAPACDLQIAARWRDQHVDMRIAVPPADSVHVELALGTPREKTVHGTVRDRGDHGVANARVTAVLDGRTAAATTDADGHYTVRTFSGAALAAGDGRHDGHAVVGRANIGDEQVDITIDEAR